MITAGGQNAVQEFRHDALNRMYLAGERTGTQGFTPACPDSSGVWCRQYSFDRTGNRSSVNNNPTAPVGSPATFNTTNNRIADPGFNYDAVGNLNQFPDSRYGSITLAYDSENRVVAVCTQDTPATCQNQPGNGRTLYVYDGLGNRVQKKDPSGNVTTYVYDAFGNLAAEYGSSRASGTQYLTPDALGSTRVAMGSQTERHDFEPFGYEVAAPAGTWRANVAGYGVDTVRQKFTGQERDNESTLDFFSARYFDGIQGRFTSPDPDMAGVDPADPQSWNAYAYVSGNPLTFTDPSGMWECATCVGASTGNPVAIAIGAAIDLGELLGGLFGILGGGGHPPDLGPVADSISNPLGANGPVTDGANDQPWNEQPPWGTTPSNPLRLPIPSLPGVGGNNLAPTPTSVVKQVASAVLDGPFNLLALFFSLGVGHTSSTDTLEGKVYAPRVTASDEDLGYKLRQVYSFIRQHLSEEEYEACIQEWREAITACTEAKGLPSNKRNTRQFGPGKDIFECARGRVPKHCGGY